MASGLNHRSCSKPVVKMRNRLSDASLEAIRHYFAAIRHEFISIGREFTSIRHQPTIFFW